MNGLYYDLRHAAIGLLQKPRLSATAALILAVGIGTNTAAYAVASAVLTNGFALVKDNARLAYLTTSNASMYYPDFEEWKAEARSFAGMALIRNIFKSMSDDAAAPATYFATEQTVDAFKVLGVKPLLGRDFLPSDYTAAASSVVIIRYALWSSRYGLDPGVVGKAVRLNGKPATIIGVMPRGFSFPTDQELWIPLMPTTAALRREGSLGRYAFGRLADGATFQSANAEFEQIGRRLATRYPQTNSGVVLSAATYQEWFVGSSSATLLRLTLAAAGVVMILVCSSVAILSLARLLSRSSEVAIRVALGAERWRVMRLCLLESLMLSGAASVVGWWIAKACVAAYARSQAVNDVNRVWSYDLNRSVLAYSGLSAVLAGLIIAVLAVRALVSLDINNALKVNGRGFLGGRWRQRWSIVLVGTSVAIAAVVLASAGTLFHSFVNVYRAQIGVEVDSVLSMGVFASPAVYPTAVERLQFIERIKSSLERIPGVESVAFGSAAPTDRVNRIVYELLGNLPTQANLGPVVGALSITEGYFETLRGRIVAGRAFDQFDRSDGGPVVIVNEAFAEQNWPSESPLGKRLRLKRGGVFTAWLEVVGVAANIVQNDRTRQAFEGLVYLPYKQFGELNMFAFARTSVPPSVLTTEVSRQMYTVDPNQPVPALWPLRHRLERAYGPERQATVIFGAFALIALVVAAAGVYCTLAHAVGERTKELAIRTAIGATRRQVCGVVLRATVVPLGAGSLAGLAGAAAANTLLRAHLVGVSAIDPVAFGSAAVLLLLALTGASLVPLRNALQVEPAGALRRD